MTVAKIPERTHSDSICRFNAESLGRQIALVAGKADDASGPCPLFAGKQVSTKAWCTAYVKKF